MQIDEIRNEVNTFETFLEKALEQKYEHLLPPDFRAHFWGINQIKRWDLRNFLEAYISCKQFPIERLEHVMYDLFDIKLQIYYVLEVDLGLYNRLIYDKGYTKRSMSEVPHILLTRFSFDQSLISKSRILWERLMNFIYHLETGELLEQKVSNKKSKRKVFFTFVKTTPKWRFLEPYEFELQGYEDKFRTPEFHKSSILRAELFGNRVNDPNELMKLFNRALIVVWDNVMAIVSGKKPSHFTDLHADQNDPNQMVHKRFLED
jgi:hypothetical protein